MTKPNRTCITPGDGDPRHGTLNGYTNLSCRGPCCRQAMATWQHTRRHTPRPTSGTTRPASHLQPP